MDKLSELEMYVDRILNDYDRLKKENEKLWEELQNTRRKIENLEKEKRDLEILLEEHQRSLNRLVERLQSILSPGEQGMIWDEEKGEDKSGE